MHDRPAVLIDCPECGRSVSDRAPACPQCGFPVADVLVSTREAQRRIDDRGSRTHAGHTDCVRCDARGFRMLQYTAPDGASRDAFEWCATCRHSGRVVLCESKLGYWAVAADHVDAFLAGEVDDHDTAIAFVGDRAPSARYS